ncbi:hypothetical protein [Oerskovia enterophila]|uniref:hypothetical protein n=1 Tax=Oerskovia enterophila TaxID=43678 RepID=UPI0033926EFC
MSATITTTVRIETSSGETLERTLVHHADGDPRFVWHETRLALDEMTVDLTRIVPVVFKDQVSMTKA